MEWIGKESKGRIAAQMPLYKSYDPIIFDLPLFVRDHKSFYELADSMGVIPEKQIGEGSVSEKDGKVTVTIKLFFNEDGELWRAGKEKKVYAMQKGSGRYKIMEYFVTKKAYDFHPTEMIMQMLAKSNQSNFIKEIGNINRAAKGKIGLKKNVLQGKKGRGYKIAATYRITMKT